MILFFSSCEGSTQRTWQITNISSFEVQLIVDSLSSQLSTNTIQPGATETVLFTDTRGGNSDPGIISNWMSFTIQSGSNVLTKDPLDDANWAVYSNQTSKIPSAYTHDFMFNFNDSDF